LAWNFANLLIVVLDKRNGERADPNSAEVLAWVFVAQVEVEERNLHG
jgi:hypothetical protein